jgi:hypothetical protein
MHHQNTAQHQCAGCGCKLPAGAPALGTKAPDGQLVTLCLSCGDRAVNDDIFARQCVFAAMSGTTRAYSESLFKKLGFDLPTDERDVRRFFGEVSRRVEADNPGVKAPSGGVR